MDFLERRRSEFRMWGNNVMVMLAPHFEIRFNDLELPDFEIEFPDEDGIIPPNSFFPPNNIRLRYNTSEHSPGISHEISHAIHFQINPAVYDHCSRRTGQITDYERIPIEVVASFGELIHSNCEELCDVPLVRVIGLSDLARLSRKKMWGIFPNLREDYAKMLDLMGVSREYA